MALEHCQRRGHLLAGVERVVIQRAAGAWPVRMVCSRAWSMTWRASGQMSITVRRGGLAGTWTRSGVGVAGAWSGASGSVVGSQSIRCGIPPSASASRPAARSGCTPAMRLNR